MISSITKTVSVFFIFISTFCYSQRFNLKTSEGIIKAGDSLLQLSGNMSLQVDDQIILEYTGKRGTEGFSNWPYIAYKTVQAMKLDTKQPDGTYARNIETGNTVRYSAERGWENYGKWSSDKYYNYSLVAKVLGIASSGRAVYLNQKSTINWKGRVYFDNVPMLDNLLKTENGWDFKKHGLKKGDTVYTSNQLESVNAVGLKILGNGVVIKSPKSCVSAGLLIHNGRDQNANPYIENISFSCNGSYDGFAPPKHFLPHSNETWYTGPMVYVPALGLYAKGAMAKNITVHNAPSYAIQGGNVDGFYVYYDSTMFKEYTGWPLHLMGGKNVSMRNGKFYSPTVMRALEIQQAENAVFENIEIINGVVSQNQGVNGSFKNISITLTENALEADMKMSAHPIMQVNQLLAGSNQSGGSFENITITQKYLTKQGHLLRAFVFYEGAKNITMKNIRSVRPDVKDVFNGNGYAAHLTASADNFLIDGFTAIGKMNRMWGCGFENVHNAPFVVAGKGKSILRNIQAQALTIGANVLTENVKTDCPVKLAE